MEAIMKLPLVFKLQIGRILAMIKQGGIEDDFDLIPQMCLHTSLTVFSKKVPFQIFSIPHIFDGVVSFGSIV